MIEQVLPAAGTAGLDGVEELAEEWTGILLREQFRPPAGTKYVFVPRESDLECDRALFCYSVGGLTISITQTDNYASVELSRREWRSVPRTLAEIQAEFRRVINSSEMARLRPGSDRPPWEKGVAAWEQGIVAADCALSTALAEMLCLAAGPRPDRVLDGEDRRAGRFILDRGAFAGLDWQPGVVPLSRRNTRSVAGGWWRRQHGRWCRTPCGRSPFRGGGSQNAGGRCDRL